MAKHELEKDAQYRKVLLEAEQKVFEAYDKAIMTLSGGALGISFAFIKDLVKSPKPESIIWLRWGWYALTASLLVVLISLLTSQWAFRTAIHQFDRGERLDNPGGWSSFITRLCNIASGLLFVVGVGLLVWFATENMSEVGK